MSRRQRSRCSKRSLLSFAFVLASIPGAYAQQAALQTPSQQIPSQQLAAGSHLRSTQDENIRQATAVTPLPKPKSDAMSNLGNPNTRKVQQQRSASGSGLLGNLFALGIVVAAFLGFTFVARRLFPSMVTRSMPREVFEVIASSQVQPKQTWMLLRFGNKLLLVCQQPGETRLISEITDLAEVQRLVAFCEKPHPSDTASQSFSWHAFLGKSPSNA